MQCQVKNLAVFAPLSHCPLQRVSCEDLQNQSPGVPSLIIRYPHISNIERGEFVSVILEEFLESRICQRKPAHRSLSGGKRRGLPEDWHCCRNVGSLAKVLLRRVGMLPRATSDGRTPPTSTSYREAWHLLRELPLTSAPGNPLDEDIQHRRRAGSATNTKVGTGK